MVTVTIPPLAVVAEGIVNEPRWYDCQSCGACCRVQPAFGGGVYIRLEQEDLDRLDQVDLDRLVTQAPEGRPALRICTDEEGEERCMALKGRIGDWVACGIYEDRPSPCRALEAGTPECLLAREEAGLERPGRHLEEHEY